MVDDENKNMNEILFKDLCWEIQNTMTLNDIDWHLRREKVAAKKKESVKK